MWKSWVEFKRNGLRFCGAKRNEPRKAKITHNTIFEIDFSVLFTIAINN